MEIKRGQEEAGDTPRRSRRRKKSQAQTMRVRCKEIRETISSTLSNYFI
jgi:hypothetical protein